MPEVKIKEVKPIKIGNSYYFLIPKQYITNETLNLTSDYDIIIKD